jgi:hypothetical protein
MSDHTQHDEAAQFRVVVDELREQLAAANARIAELEAGPKTVEPHIVDPEKWDYTYDGDPVTDLVYDKDEPTYPWGAYSSGRSWTASGQWVDGVSNPARDLIPTPKASKGEQQ